MSTSHTTTLGSTLYLVKERKSTVSVIGLGKMGLPLATVVASAGFNVVGVDLNAKLVASVNNGQTDLNEPGVPEQLSRAVRSGKFKATTSLQEALKEARIVLVIIPTLTNENNQLEEEPLRRLYEDIATHLQPGTIIIQESTVPPGTTGGMLREIVEKKSGMKVGKDIGLGFAPERTYSGRVIADITERYPKIVGAVDGDADTAEIMKEFYSSFCSKGVIVVRNAITAEAVKVFKGAYRDVNIALANQFAVLSELIGIDVVEAINAANTEPFSHIHRPGIGVGGHCIPVYPYFLTQQAAKYGYEMSLLLEGRRINDSMPILAIQRVEDVLAGMGSTLEHETVIILGLAYRGGVKEHRNSPSLILARELKQKTKEVFLSDPLYTSDEIQNITGLSSPMDEDFARATVFFIATDHESYREINWGEFCKGKNRCIIYDGRYIIDASSIPKNSILLAPGKKAVIGEKLSVIQKRE